MAGNGSKRRRQGKVQVQGLGKRRGIISPRVARVGGEHFGIVPVDCAKARSKWMLADFYGRVLIGPTVVEHTKGGLESAIHLVRQGIEEHHLRDQIIAVEQTGRYHKPLARAFSAGGLEVRLVHPLASRPFRQAADPGIKTDDKDLGGIFGAATHGLALVEPVVDEFWAGFQLLTRHRRDLVRKASSLCCQIKEHLEAAMPGYAACFPTLWDHPAALSLALDFADDDQATVAEAMQRAGALGLAGHLRRVKIGFQQRTIQRVVEWSAGAASPDAGHRWHHRIAVELEADRRAKNRQIQGVEQDIAARLSATPYVLLVSIPGINVVSAGEYAGEMGPISHYAHSRCITGRAGLYPSRYQSDQVDRADGPLVRCGNRRLRYALLLIAENLLKCNRHFAALATRWKQQGRDPRDHHVRVASRFARISFQMVAGRMVFRHPAVAGRNYVLDKLLRFHGEHQTGPEQMLADLRAAAGQLPPGERAAEAAPLAEQLAEVQARRRGRGPQPLGEILPLVLAELGLEQIQSAGSGAPGPA
jgi:transposase